MTEKTKLVPSAAVEKSLAPAASDIPVVPSPDIPALEFTPARGESERAFEAFRAYLELGPGRRYAAAGRKVGAALAPAAMTSPMPCATSSPPAAAPFAYAGFPDFNRSLL
ncbi:MAG: hypothetical protein WCJ07_06475 [Verrucomicrobiota bacterium]